MDAPADRSPFQIPSSPKLDQMWSDLYNCRDLLSLNSQGTNTCAKPDGISKITKDEAARLPNKTHAIPGDEDHYVG
jgi:hypothetical protein